MSDWVPPEPFEEGTEAHRQWTFRGTREEREQLAAELAQQEQEGPPQSESLFDQQQTV